MRSVRSFATDLCAIDSSGLDAQGRTVVLAHAALTLRCGRTGASVALTLRVERD